MVRVKFMPDGRVIESNVGDNLLETAQQHGIDVTGPCGGRALCGKCVVKILQGTEFINPLTNDEQSVLSGKKISEGYRLCCRCKIIDDGEIILFIPSESRQSEYVLLTEGLILEEKLDPMVRILRINSPDRPFGSLVETLKVPGKYEHEALVKLSQMVEGGKTISMIFHGGTVLDVKNECLPLGFAVDVGTTKVAGYLVDLESGKTLNTVAQLNPQVVYGEDVISRVTYALRNGVSNLNQKIIECLNDLLRSACIQAGLSPQDVYELCIVGNTAMHHFLLGFHVKTLAYYPYSPVIRDDIYLKASSLGLQANKLAYVFIPPLIAGFIGADVVADIIATEFFKTYSTELLIDIGTNTEIILSKEGEFIACSTPSGPTFEGVHVKWGMRAAKGAINKIKISEDGEVEYTVIGDVKPRGITGSAIVDALAELYKAGFVDSSGRFVDKRSKRLRKDIDGISEFVIVEKENTSMSADITINQKDVREIQLAKAAIRSGINVLLKTMDVKEDEVEKISIAGAFGFYLNPLSAQTIGLYPETIDPNRIRVVGNAAGAGARALLLSSSLREEARKIARKVQYLELAKQPNFQKEFLNAIHLPRSLSSKS